MAHWGPLNSTSQQPVYISTTREREFLKYLPSDHLQSDLQYVDRDTHTAGFVARSSSDPVLTALAQLGALRLDAKRGMISLFGRHKQHVLAEATQTLSLQDDTHHKPHDNLWVGSCTMSYERSFCKAVMNAPPQGTEGVDRLFVASDLTQNELFKESPGVTSHPNIRFLASSPIISPKGIVIGAYSILDDKVHAPLDADIMKFLMDVASTVMDYLEVTRSRQRHLRGERMIVGLGSFLEGKGGLRNSWMDANDLPQSPSGDNDVEGLVNREQQERQITDGVARSMKDESLQGFSSIVPPNFNISGEQKSKTQLKQNHSMTGSNFSSKTHWKDRHTSQTALAADKEQSRKQSPKDAYTDQLRDTFSRAANIIRESIEVEAAVFFDANLSSQEASINNRMSDFESSVEGYSSSDEEPRRRKTSNASLAGSSGKAVENPCKILGFATSVTTSVNNQPVGDDKIAISESFLEALLRRYPSGKIFNFGEDGSISSDDTSDGVFKKAFQHSRGKKYKKTQRVILRQDAAVLLQLAPNARSIVFSPLWDSHKERWGSACISWTKAPHRILTADDELAFLFAFGNSVMAEVHRLDALFAQWAKSDLLAGISHELRSPLHGIFGTIELLNDTTLNTLQRGFVHTMSSCTFTLLNLIDQLLEFASINDVRPKSHVADSLSRLEVRESSQSFNLQPEKIDKSSIVQLDATVEDVIETVFAGYSFFSNSGTPLWDFANGNSSPQKRVRVIVDIDCAQNFKFSSPPGAWHLIITNIFGNALKFTQEGYIQVSLKADPVQFNHNGQATRSRVTLSVRDTGCGMKQEYLKNKLFTAFTQEDSMSTGNGLGLNIVRRMVASLGGDIHVASQKGLGTEFITTVILNHVFELDSSNDSSTQLFPIPTRALVFEKTIGILGLGASDADATLCSSLQKQCRDWFQMEAQLLTPSHPKFGHCDLYIFLSNYLDTNDLETMPIFPGPHDRLRPPVVVICLSPRIAHRRCLDSRKREDAEILEFISQPCGPRKLAKAFEFCFHRQQQQIELVRDQEKTTSAPPTPDAFEKQSPFRFLIPRVGGNSRDPPSISVPMRKLREDVDNDHPGEEQLLRKAEANSVQTQRDPSAIVLLVDDNEINLRLLIASMKKLGYNYATAQNGQEALDFYEKNAYDIGVVLMDISMPIMDGLESARRIREFEKTLQDKNRTMILALTGVAQAEMEHNAIRSGMDMFLTKPVRLDRLGPIIKEKLITIQSTQQ